LEGGQWSRIDDLFHRAADLAPADRCAFLDRACGDDEELRRELDSLLAADTPDDGVIEAAIEGPAERIGPYQILREIGRGGMGTVYLAERADGEYRKQVALKLVSPQLVTEEILRRFRNERQVEALLDHPNIARLLDGGTTEDDRPYLVMEYVDGVRIDAWCDSRKLAVGERLKLFRQVCAAVQAVHEKGIIHRDIKPGNILVTADGTPKLLDFGIAKVLNPGPSESAESTIGPGPMTPEYASPEQVRGDRVGPASDIYALGVVLYQLLTGQLPYAAQGGDLRTAICEQEAVAPSKAVQRAGRPRTLRRQLAGDLDNIVLKSLRKETDRRYRSVTQFSEDLDRFFRDLPVQATGESLRYRGRMFLKRNRSAILAAALSAMLVLAVVAGLGKRRGSTDDAGVRSIAVLPLDNLSGDQEQEYFADGVTDALISELARSRTARVISRTSVMTYKRPHGSLPQIAKALGVQTIAEGSVLRAGSRVRISMRLVDAKKDRPFWSGSYEGEPRDVLALQARVAGAIAREIDVTLTARDTAQVSQSRQINLDAYDAYLKGRHEYFTAFNKESTQKAIDWFQRAIVFDPGYAPAYAGLADCYYMVSNQYYAPTEVMPKAKAAALRAIELDDTLGEAHATLALIRSVYDFNHGEAEKGFQQALKLKPGDATVHTWYGLYLVAMGRFDDGAAELEQAQKLDPVSPALNGYSGAVLYYAHRYDEVIRRMRPIIEKNPDYQQPYAWIALAYEQKGEWDKAIAAMEKSTQLVGGEVDGLAQLAHIYAVVGRKGDSRRVLKRVKEIARHRFVSAWDFALIHAGLGEQDEAFRWLQKVEQDRSEMFVLMNVDPRFDPLRADPRFPGVLRSAGLTH
jgi:serine/threonine protein kinase/tetratricopeptide (TPR) repeat protein